MRAAVVHCFEGSAHADIAKALAKGIERQGHDVTVVNAGTQSGKSLTAFHYIAVGTAAPSLFSRAVPLKLTAFLKSAGMISGKRCYAFTAGGGFRKAALLRSLMKVMEGEGMYLKKSDIIKNSAEAEAIGCRLHIH
ncbi:MAG: hypothetical protein B0D92_05175 [Spirochaeta sp. LUC14_002_19_P3]|nr:MAG: hypothetical protein B0D92_05175 [Spirochaeta sp. LUC14_002_19_P3]